MVAYYDATRDLMQPLVGKRIEIPNHYNYWVCGMRYGLVTGWRRGQRAKSAYLMVKMEDGEVLKIWKSEVEHCRVLED